MDSLKRFAGRRSGVLIVEAIVAAFLMVFAFAAAATLFDGALRWESQGANLRKATLVAERKMEELRRDCSDIPAGTTFAAHADTVLGLPVTPYPEDPGFTIEVDVLPHTNQRIQANGLTPTPGVHSPCSAFFTLPPTLPADDPGGDFQRNRRYQTFPYSRPMAESFRQVQVTVYYGGGTPPNSRFVRLVSLIGDPILPPSATTPNENITVRVIRESGSPSSLSAGSPSAFYSLEVVTNSGAEVENVAAVWNITPDSTGHARIFTMDSSGQRVRITRGNLAVGGTEVRLAAKVRYGGVEAIGISQRIRIL